MSNWKLYVHHEADPAYTKLVKVSDPQTTTLNSAIQEFVAAFNNQHGSQHSLQASGVSVFNDRRKQLSLDSTVAKVVKDRADLFVVKDDRPAAPVAAAPSKTGASAPTVEQVPVSKPVETLAASKSKALFDPRNIERRFQPVVKPYLDQATDALANKNFKLAKQNLEKVFDYVKGHRQALKLMARMWLEAGKSSLAVEWAQRAVDEDLEDPDAHRVLADSLSAAGNNEQAVDEYKATIQLLKQKGRSVQEEDDAQLALARALIALGGSERDMGAGIVMDVLRRDENQELALELYARIALERGVVEDAVKVSMRLLGTKSTNQAVRAVLAEALQREGGVDILFGVFTEQTPDTAAAFGFLANAVKDHGAVAEAAALLRRALDLAPSSASYCLNLVHTLELLGQYDEGLAATRKLLGSTPDRLGGGVDLEVLSRELAPELPPLGKLTSLSWLTADAWTPDGDAARDLKAEVLVPESQKVQYSNEQLDLLALLFTAAKILYVGGALTAAARLCAVVQQARDAAKQELHMTLIRNEAAYFGCVLQLLRDYPPPDSAHAATAPPLYLLGDSHCLPAAWRFVTLRGEQRLLHPMLVTGCKIWHIRTASTFYPKRQFLNSVAALPNGAQVITMFGEIDCREGMLQAVQKSKYDSIEDAIDAAIDIYLAILLGLIKERRFEIFVHPVAPVLDETRPVVRPFNRRLRQRVMEAAKRQQAQGRLHYLDFTNSLMVGGEASAPRFNPELQFDDTHMSPKYIKYMQAELDKIPPLP